MSTKGGPDSGRPFFVSARASARYVIWRIQPGVRTVQR